MDDQYTSDGKVVPAEARAEAEYLKGRVAELMGADLKSFGVEVPKSVRDASLNLMNDLRTCVNCDGSMLEYVKRDVNTLDKWINSFKPDPKKEPSNPEDVVESFENAHFVKDDFYGKGVCEFIVKFDGSYFEAAKGYAFEVAKELGVIGFKNTFNAFLKEIRPSDTNEPKPFYFQGSSIQDELDPGGWKTDGEQIWKEVGFERRYACKHPILPTATLTNIDDRSVKTQLEYKRNGRWETVIVPNEMISSTRKITEGLSRIGISVTSSTAPYLSDYLDDIKEKNRDIIPERKSVGRLGWMGDSLGFVPYTDKLAMDDESRFEDILSSIKPAGTFEAWKDAANQLRTTTEMQIVLAASFASVLLNIVQCQPFFVHIWSPDSGSGKTVSMKLAASVWANPESGYIRNFSGTSVSFELAAAFLNHLPLIVDELQLGNQDGNKKRFDVYALAEGFGKSRGTKSLGVQAARTWRNVIITSGETSITDSSSASGVVNRILDVWIKPYQKIIDEKTVGGICETMAANYGHAGRIFVERVYQIKDAVRNRYKELCEALRHSTTGKQANAGAAIILADEYLNGFIFETPPTLTVEKLSEYLASSKDADVAARAYTYMQGMLVQQTNCIEQDGGVGADRTLPRTIGRQAGDGEHVYIVKPEFERILKDGGFDARAVISAMAVNGRIRVTPGRLKARIYTVPHNVGAGRTECYCFNLGKKSESDDGEEADTTVGATSETSQIRSENSENCDELPF